MEQIDTQIGEKLQENKPTKKTRRTWGIILAVALIAVAAVLYVKLYKIPHDEAVRQHNEAAAKYNDTVDIIAEISKILGVGAQTAQR